MAVSITQGGATNGAFRSGAGTTIAKAFTNPVTSGGSMVVAVLITDTTTTLSTVADDKSNSFTINSGPSTLITATNRLYFASFLNATNGPQTITATLGTTGIPAQMWIWEVAALATSSSFDKIQTGAATSITPNIALTPTLADSFSCMIYDEGAGGPRVSVQNSFIANQEIANQNWETAISKAINGNETAQATQTLSRAWNAIAAIYKGVSATNIVPRLNLQRQQMAA